MLQPKNSLMKREILLGWEPRVDRKVFAIIGFPDFAFGISIVSSDCCPATVSDSETVFLCPLSLAAAVAQHAASRYGEG
ncbi:hypothetical protein [Hymenobacter norwichensis]|uniref:hypothetical protein n=1 Tax=Hymenobacter norwichensis TaxID=223903 RepID=UPI0003B58D1B|nr:hypothetical protein [Hymenobacter norwichensis]